MEAESKITLIGTRIADIGMEFIFMGPTSECEQCRLRNTCVETLDEGRRYRVVGVRNSSKRDCNLHDNGVCVVEVVESPIIAAIEARRAFDGSKIVYESPSCEEDCNLYDLCNPAGLKENDKYKITKVMGEAPDRCKKDKSLKLVELSR